GSFAVGRRSRPKLGVSIGGIRYFRFLFLIRWIRLLYEIAKWRPDVIEIHFIPVGFPLFLVARPVTYFFHGPAGLEAQSDGEPVIISALQHRVEEFCLRRSRKIFCASRTFGRILTEVHPFLLARQRTPIVRYPKICTADGTEASTTPTTGNIPPALGTLTDDIVFVCVRRLVKRTGVELLLKAFDRALYEARIPQTTTLLIAGSGPLEDAVKKLVADLGRADNVRLLGFISDELRDWLYELAYYNIVPRVALECFGLVGLRAAICGCPSIVTNIGGLPEVIDLLDKVGLVCDPDVASLAQAMENAIHMGPIDRQLLRQKTLKRFAIRRTKGPSI